MDEVRNDHTTCKDNTIVIDRLQRLASKSECRELVEKARELIEQLEPELLDEL